LSEPGQSTHPQFFDAVKAAFKPSGDVGKRQALQVAEDKNVPIIGRQAFEGICKAHRLFTANGLLTGRGLGRNQSAVEDAGRLVQPDFNFALETDIASLRTKEAPTEVGEIGGHDLPQPVGELSSSFAAKTGKPAVCFKERFLNQIGSINFTLKPKTDLDPREHGQVATVAFEQLAEPVGVAGPRLAQQQVRIVVHRQVMNPSAESFRAK
jgi:hypothetical protein